MALAGTKLGAHYMWHRARDLRARCPLAPGGSAVMSRNGFTLIELLIVVVIIGLLATIAIPKFSNTKEKAYVASMKSDLRNLATAEEAFFYDSTKYTTNFALMNNFNPSAGVRSEEHTSELQSQSNIVCRLLLEKKTPTEVSLSPRHDCRAVQR